MKLRLAIPTVALAVAGALPVMASTAGAVATTQVTIVDGYQYDATNLIALTVCLDDTIVQDNAETVINPAVTSTPGAHTLSVTQDTVASCSDDANWITADVNLLDTASQALTFGWPIYNQDQTRSLPVWLFADDLSCTPADQGRVAFRNINSADVTADFGQIDGATETPLFSDIAVGAGDTTLVPSSVYPASGTAAGWVSSDTSPVTPFVSPFTSLVTDPGTLNVVYAYAGNDGSIGLVNQVLPASVCDTPTTTTTLPAEEPTTVAPAAVAVTTQPTYTG